jgi:alpha-beta hydrolase superfamily lysophospholipase
MVIRKQWIGVALVCIVFAAGCGMLGGGATGDGRTVEIGAGTLPPVGSGPSAAATVSATLPGTFSPGAALASATPTWTAEPSSTVTPTPTATEETFKVGREITLEYLRDLVITGSDVTIEQNLADGPNYHQYLASYISQGNKIYALLTVPFGNPPEGGFKAIVFCHGYIPPVAYRTTERYTAYVNYLARSGFVVFKIDYRGNGQSGGEAEGSYFSPGYTIDAIAALKSLQRMDIINPQGIGMWGHSMAGNLVLRAMEMEPGIQAGVIWAGAVYSYDDFTKYGISDPSYRPPPTQESGGESGSRRRSQQIFDTYGRPDTAVDYWKAVSLTENIDYLTSPLQIHHAQNDPVVNIGYSIDLAAVLKAHGKEYEFYTYEGGGHNLVSPYFDQAMQRTVAFFKDHL